jgi:hypothetical protein
VLALTLAYLAGVFDSDGSFTLSRHSRKGAFGFNYEVYLQLTWKEVPETVKVMEELKRAYGGTVIRGIETRGFSTATSYVKYRINSRQAAVLIQDMLPFLRVKRRQAQICLEAAKIIGKVRYTRWRRRPPSDRARLGELYKQVANLNWKNGKGRRLVK